MQEDTKAGDLAHEGVAKKSGNINNARTHRLAKEGMAGMPDNKADNNKIDDNQQSQT